MRFNLTVIVLFILNITNVSLVIGDDRAEYGGSEEQELLILEEGAISDDIEWVTGLRNLTRVVWQNLRQIFGKQAASPRRGRIMGPSGPEEIEAENVATLNIDKGRTRQFKGLYIFVSSSMPIPLLQNYLNEANKYGAVLVLKGSPP